MTQATVTTDLYPDFDGQPMADNTKQYRWIVRLVSNLRNLLQGQTALQVRSGDGKTAGTGYRSQ
jgi:hypothetical protein